MDGFGFLYAIFVGLPVAITLLNIWNMFARRKFFPRVLLFLTVIFGIFCYIFYLSYRDVRGAEWNEAIYYFEKHTDVSNEFVISFVLLLAVGVVSLFTLALVPAKKLSPIAASFSLAGFLSGNVLNLFYGLQVAPLFLLLSFRLQS